jgi:hypothetical protein
MHKIKVYEIKCLLFITEIVYVTLFDIRVNIANITPRVRCIYKPVSALFRTNL